MRISPKLKKRLWQVSAAIFIFLNLIAFLHAYNFTHFVEADLPRIRDNQQLTLGQKLKMLLFGVNNPRPKLRATPSRPFETVTLTGEVKLEGWHLKTNGLAQGTVILFHGYSGVKSTYLKNAEAFLDWGYNVLLIDFRGSGGSEGMQTTIGFKEADDVKTAYDFVKNKGENKILLAGNSMGAAAILRSLAVHDLKPTAILLQCPFGSMQEAVNSRFHKMGVPTFPMAHLLTFWGGVQNGFWAFNHNPADYAAAVKCPTLLQWGAKDDRVSRSETDAIYKNLRGEKVLKIFDDAIHENYAFRFDTEWEESVVAFLKSVK
jgi:uncharacterized protein